MEDKQELRQAGGSVRESEVKSIGKNKTSSDEKKNLPKKTRIVRVTMDSVEDNELELMKHQMDLYKHRLAIEEKRVPIQKKHSGAFVEALKAIVKNKNGNAWEATGNKSSFFSTTTQENAFLYIKILKIFCWCQFRLRRASSLWDEVAKGITSPPGFMHVYSCKVGGAHQKNSDPFPSW